MTGDEVVGYHHDDTITNSMDLSLSQLWEMVSNTGKPGVLQSVGHKESDNYKSKATNS